MTELWCNHDDTVPSSYSTTKWRAGLFLWRCMISWFLKVCALGKSLASRCSHPKRVDRMGRYRYTHTTYICIYKIDGNCMYFVTWVYWVHTLFANSGKFHHFPSSSRLPENHCARFEGAAITCQRPGSWSDRSAVVPMKWAFRWVNYWNLSRWMDGWMDRSVCNMIL